MKTIDWELIRDVIDVGGALLIGLVMIGLGVIIVKIVIVILKQDTIRGPRGFTGETGPKGDMGPEGRIGKCNCQCKTKEL